MKLLKDEASKMAWIAATVIVLGLLALGTTYWTGPDSVETKAVEEVLEYESENELHIPASLVEKEEEIILHKKPSKED
jgi:hypothetical protein